MDTRRVEVLFAWPTQWAKASLILPVGIVGSRCGWQPHAGRSSSRVFPPVPTHAAQICARPLAPTAFPEQFRNCRLRPPHVPQQCAPLAAFRSCNEMGSISSQSMVIGNLADQLVREAVCQAMLRSRSRCVPTLREPGLVHDIGSLNLGSRGSLATHPRNRTRSSECSLGSHRGSYIVDPSTLMLRPR